MSLNVLIASPADEKFFVDLAASCLFAKRHHPELSVDVLVPAANIPSWWSFSAPWLQIINEASQAKTRYDLIIQLHPDPTIADALKTIETEHRSGVMAHEGITVNGRWAQVFFAQIGATRFAPFSAHDLFNHIILGRTAPHVPTPTATPQGDWVVDVESMPQQWRAWGEELLSQLNFAHPNRTRMDLAHPLRPEKVSAYIGCNAALASWLAFHQVPVVLLHEKELDPRLVLAGSQCSYVQFQPQLTSGKVLAMLRPGSTSNEAIRYTDEYLGGLARVLTEERIESVTPVFDHLHYVVFNYLNDLREVDLPIPPVSAAACMQLKGITSVLTKLVHLNQFGMRYLQEFLAKVEVGNVSDKDINDISNKMREIDDLTERSLTNYPEFDVYRFTLRFAKGSAQGSNIVEIAKSLILILHESNQTLQVYSELLDTTIKRHVKPQDNSNA